MSIDNDQSLFSLGARVLGLFDNLLYTFHHADPNAIAAIDIMEVHETRDRLILWASNVGLFNLAHTSLDYRLRDNGMIKTFTKDLLHNLSQKISELSQIASGQRAPFDLLESDDEDEIQNASVDKDVVLDEEDFDSVNSDVEIITGPMNVADNQTEAALLFEQLCANISQLFNLAVQIRSPTARRVPAIKEIDLFKHIDPEIKKEIIKSSEDREYLGLVQVFEQCRKEIQGRGQDDMEHYQLEQDHPEEYESLDEGDQVLLRRLLKANRVRRCYFQYWKRYKSKSMQFTSRVIKKDAVLNPPSKHSHGPSVYQGDEVTTRSSPFSHQPSSRLTSEMPLAPEFALKAPSSTRSSRSRAVSVEGADGFVVQWPLPPFQAQKRIADFECPYCFFICPSRTKREDAWRDHLRRDLQPYVCTYLECHDPDELYYDYDSWNMHEQRTHRRIWACKIDKESFTEQCSYEEHVRLLHPDLAKKLLTQELIASRESTPKLCDRECPICLRNFIQTHEMQLHIAHHLENIALLALPLVDDQESISGDGSLVQSDVAEKRGRLLGLSTGGDFPEAEGLPPEFPENDPSDFRDVKELGERSRLTIEALGEHLESSFESPGSKAERILDWRSAIGEEQEPDDSKQRIDKPIPEDNVVNWLWKELRRAVKRTGEERKISYIAKNDLERLTSHDIISAIVDDPNADFTVPIQDIDGRRKLASRIYHEAHALLAIFVFEKLSFNLLEHILANSTTDKVLLPLPGEIPGWLDDEVLRFEYNTLVERQWPFQAAIFQRVGQEQNFDPNIIVPYISKVEFDHGAFSTLYRVRIEKSHQRLYRLPRDENPELALKVMLRRRNMEKAFQNEHIVLKGLRNLNHDHIIKLLGIYRQEDNYHFLFPLADQNLGHYMAQDPLGFNMPESQKSKDALAWMWGQLEGIASGLCKIHVNSQKSETAKKPAGKAKSGTDQPIEPTFLNPDVERQNRPIGTGYHHDIKPENILHFSQNMIAKTKTGVPAHGILQIADFGIGKFHSELSGTGTGTFRGTITYAAPESKVAPRIGGDNGQTSSGGLKVSRPYDVWSFGCVLMEVLVWMIFGKEGRKQFGMDRTGPAEEDDPNYMNDAFFYLKNFPREAHVRESVIGWMEKLRDSHRIKSQPSGSLARVLKLVEEILNVDPIKRMSAKEVTQQLGIVVNAARNEAYCGLEPIAEELSEDSTDTE